MFWKLMFAKQSVCSVSALVKKVRFENSPFRNKVSVVLLVYSRLYARCNLIDEITKSLQMNSTSPGYHIDCRMSFSEFEIIL